MDGIVAVTYRCNCRCLMCETWRHPSRPEAEIAPQLLEKLPPLVRLNVTGGEPFLREDLDRILSIVKRKAKRVVISSNGVLTDRTLRVMSRHRDVGVRISFDGMSATHEAIRGVPGIHHRALETLRGLKSLGIRDLGIAVTVSDQNAGELVDLYRLARREGVELATAILHNAYYFHKTDNRIEDPAVVQAGIEPLIDAYLASSSPKDWFRGYFTRGLVEHLHGRKRLLKCTMARDSFFVDPFGLVRPCNVMDHPFGNLNDESFEALWTGARADKARRRVECCPENCWMIGSVGHLMRRRIWEPFAWIATRKWLKRREEA
ncbi:radical SAM protein [Geomesophilobacter sediminis]|uniref:Radical SAM protein n=1 Tax=Geomesophilobacter sediminis TaxID=2798584 RepID=A0A8J7LY38_9BACT|nr:radical SAM protein [Geomesophilobacter sediminis]MBJ6724261.1 radical SAM protein [Geomesophilobacter sediminis]